MPRNASIGRESLVPCARETAASEPPGARSAARHHARRRSDGAGERASARARAPHQGQEEREEGVGGPKADVLPPDEVARHARLGAQVRVTHVLLRARAHAGGAADHHEHAHGEDVRGEVPAVGAKLDKDHGVHREARDRKQEEVEADEEAHDEALLVEVRERDAVREREDARRAREPQPPVVALELGHALARVHLPADEQHPAALEDHLEQPDHRHRVAALHEDVHPRLGERVRRPLDVLDRDAAVGDLVRLHERDRRQPQPGQREEAAEQRPELGVLLVVQQREAREAVARDLEAAAVDDVEALLLVLARVRALDLERGADRLGARDVVALDERRCLEPVALAAHLGERFAHVPARLDPIKEQHLDEAQAAQHAEARLFARESARATARARARAE